MSKKTKAGSVVRRFGNGGENIATRGPVYAEKKNAFSLIFRQDICTKCNSNPLKDTIIVGYENKEPYIS